MIQGEFFNLTPELRNLFVQRMHVVQQNYGGDDLVLFCGRESHPRRYRLPLSGTDEGDVYYASPNWHPDDRSMMEAIVADGVNGQDYHHNQLQVDYFTNMLFLTKIGSAANFRTRLSLYCYGTCLFGSMLYGVARSRRQRPDETNRQREILGFSATAPSGTYPNLLATSPHISGEWMRCTPAQRQDVRINTHNEPYNPSNPLSTSEGIYERRELALDVPRSENLFIFFIFVIHVEYSLTTISQILVLIGICLIQMPGVEL